MICGTCGAGAQEGQRFCGKCGTPLASPCPACGAENPPDHSFCGTCGTAITSAPGPVVVAVPVPAPVAERRLVSVLFADLVGYTTISEHRDPEEVRAFDLMAEESGTTTVVALRELRLCSLAAGERELLETALTQTEALLPGYSSPMLEAEAALGRAQLAAPDDSEAAYARAVALHRELDTPFGLAQALLGQGEALLARDDSSGAEPLVDEAHELFAKLGARAWVERASLPRPTAVA